jgi:hypothetical protein
MKYEYLRDAISTQGADVTQAHLDRRSADGWRLANVILNSAGMEILYWERKAALAGEMPPKPSLAELAENAQAGSAFAVTGRR